MPRVNKTVFVSWKSIKNMDCVQQIFFIYTANKIKKKSGSWKYFSGVSSPIAQTHQAMVGVEEGLFLSLSLLFWKCHYMTWTESS